MIYEFDNGHSSSRRVVMLPLDLRDRAVQAISSGDRTHRRMTWINRVPSRAAMTILPIDPSLLACPLFQIYSSALQLRQVYLDVSGVEG
jgi:hypothetical protein